ncbi:MAG: ABC transporter ATP-binding protein, partial [Chloroflexi bacterium RBG_16_57_9]
MLELYNIHAYYGDSHVLQGVSLKVNAGEVVAVLGRNGAGKTTTVHSIIGFVPVRKGRIMFHGRDVTGKPAHQIARQGIGLVPQGRRLFPELTVRENLTLAARHGNGGSSWDLDAAFKYFPHLKERLNFRASKLSGGEQQMVTIARALLTNPLLLLMDEPSEGLAPLMVLEIGRIVNVLKAAGLSILLVEQNLPLALRVADRVYVMNKGQIVFEG